MEEQLIEMYFSFQEIKIFSWRAWQQLAFNHRRITHGGPGVGVGGGVGTWLGADHQPCFQRPCLPQDRLKVLFDESISFLEKEEGNKTWRGAAESSCLVLFHMRGRLSGRESGRGRHGRRDPSIEEFLNTCVQILGLLMNLDKSTVDGRRSCGVQGPSPSLRESGPIHLTLPSFGGRERIVPYAKLDLLVKPAAVLQG